MINIPFHAQECMLQNVAHIDGWFHIVCISLKLKIEDSKLKPSDFKLIIFCSF